MIPRAPKIPELPEAADRALRAALDSIIAEVRRIGAPPPVSGLKHDGHFAAEGGIVRVRGGQRVALPRARAENAGNAIVVIVEVAGAISITAHRGNVNGARVQTLSDVGAYTFYSNGVDGWYMQGSLPGTSSGGAALDAEYLLGAAHASLPSGRLATDSTEIDAELTVANVVSWALRTASVGFSKLANLAGLSVLGRSASSSGVMAAVTATDGYQALRSNPAGTSIGWESYLPTTHTATVSGTVDPLPLPAGLMHGDNLSISTSTGNVTLNGIDATGVPVGFTFFLGFGVTVGDLINTSFLLQDEAAGTATNEMNLPGNQSIRALSGSRVMIRRGTSAWQVEILPQMIVRNNGTLQAPRSVLNFVNSTTNTAVVNPDATNNEHEISYQRAALSGAITASANSNTTAFGALAAKSVLANATNASAVPAALAGSAAFQHLRVNSANNALEWAVLSLSAFPSMAAGSFLANVTAGAAVPTAHDLATFAGAGLTYTNVTGIMAVGAGTGITVNANDVQINLAAALTWTGNHTHSAGNWTMNSAGDFAATAATVSLLSSSTMLLDSVGDMTLQTDGDLILQGDEVRVRSNGTGGFLTFDGATASTPGLAAGEGMYWVEDPGAGATIPRFTDDANVDWKILAFGQPADNSLTVGNSSLIGTAFIIYRDVVSSGVAAAGDTNIFNGTAPFAFTVVMCGVRVSAGVGGTSVTFRDALAGGGNAVSSALSTATSGTAQVGANFTGAIQIASGGTLTARWTNRTCEGRIWALCVRD